MQAVGAITNPDSLLQGMERRCRPSKLHQATSLPQPGLPRQASDLTGNIQLIKTMKKKQFSSIPHRPSRGISRGALSSIVPAGSDMRTTVQPSKPKSTTKITLAKKGLRVCTFNVRTLNDTGAPESLARELSRLDISIAGLQEVCFPGQGKMSVDGYEIFWSGRSDGKRKVQLYASTVNLGLHSKDGGQSTRGCYLPSSGIPEETSQYQCVTLQLFIFHTS